jgi:DNA mismatch repair protein MutS2
LEFDKVLDLLERHLRTPISAPLLRASAPADDFDRLETRFREIDQVGILLERGQSFPFEGISDIQSILKQAEFAGSVCEGTDLLRVLENLRAVRALRNSLSQATAPLGPLNVYLSRLVPTDELEERLAACLESDGTLKDSASPALKKIRAQIKRQRGHIQRRLEELCRSAGVRDRLQEDYFTERRGRYVLPVQSGQKRKIAGIQHGRSDTGTTVYIEPLELVEAGNLLSEANEEEEREILRILKELTSEVRKQHPAIRSNLETVAEFDLVVGLADYNQAVRGTLPVLQREGPLDLRGIRHPLLLSRMELEQVVANDVFIPTESAGFLITGPNTGGKTVVLKSAGLLCSLALSGIPIPCGPGTRIPLLGAVLADIGDEQSIEQSLSTFSSHVARLKSFLETAKEVQREGAPRALIILDELGAGTDPAEGAPLGRAVLEELIDRGAWLLVATHLGDLKLFAHENSSILSGSMRFDSGTLSPTFELLMNTVGESHGLEIAERLGLPEKVIARAKGLIEADPNEAAGLLLRLTEEEKRARENREETERLKAEAEEKRDTLIRRIEQTAREEQKILNQARHEAEQKIRSAKNRVARLEETLAKEEQKLKSGYSGREKNLEERERHLAWLEKELEDRVRALIELAKRFPNFVPESLKFPELEKLRVDRLGEPEWRKVLRAINREEESLARDFGPKTSVAQVAEETRPGWDDIAPGDSLQVEGWEQPVTVAGKNERKKELSILVGNLNSEIPYSRVLRKLSRKQGKALADAGSSAVARSLGSDVPSEANLIGMTIEEMEPVLQKYLDSAALSGWDEVRVIHGFGTGALREGVQRLLREHPSVREFRKGGEGEGGGGATVVRFKR